jgi:hypothetical protein
MELSGKLSFLIPNEMVVEKLNKNESKLHIQYFVLYTVQSVNKQNSTTLLSCSESKLVLTN